jgi:chromosome partitioning protein
MHRIVVANAKGGCGKSLVATSLAGFFAHHGRKTTLVDCDPQQASAAWCADRPRNLPAIAAISVSDPTFGIGAGLALRVPPATEFLLIDTPAGLRSHQLSQLTRNAGVLLVPVVPSATDLRVTAGFLQSLHSLPEVRSGALRVGIVANRVRERTLAARALSAGLDKLARAALVRIRDSQVYVNLAASGRSVFDDPGTSAREHRGDWLPLLGWLLNPGRPTLSADLLLPAANDTSGPAEAVPAV